MNDKVTGRRQAFGPVGVARIEDLSHRAYELRRTPVSRDIASATLRTMRDSLEPTALDTSFTRLFGSGSHTSPVAFTEEQIAELSAHFGTKEEIAAADMIYRDLHGIWWPLKQLGDGKPLPVSTTLETGATLTNVLWTHAEHVASGGRRLIDKEVSEDLEAAFDALIPRVAGARSHLSAVFRGDADANVALDPVQVGRVTPLWHMPKQGWARLSAIYGSFADALVEPGCKTTSPELATDLRNLPTLLKERASSHVACVEVLEQALIRLADVKEDIIGIRSRQAGELTEAVLQVARWSTAWPEQQRPTTPNPDHFLVSKPPRWVSD